MSDAHDLVPAFEEPTTDEAPTPLAPFNPAELGFPVTLPVELALGEEKPADICAAYEITRDQFSKIIQNPVFQKAYLDAQKMLQQEGMSYRIKARMQAEELLKTSWNLIHSSFTPASVKAQLIIHTAKVAGLEPKEGAATSVPLNIQINLG
jgi:hypothetical protein